MQKILFITGTRAEYGILEPLIFKFKEQKDFDVKLLVTGMHTLKTYGYTADYIKGRCTIDYIVPISENGNQLKRLGEEIIGIEKNITDEGFDYVFVLGDRDEAFAGAIVGSHLNIPVCHIHGGDTTGHLPDEYIRNAITKMSLLHFVACEQHGNKVKNMGENPKLIFNVGALCFDGIEGIPLYDRHYLSKELGIDEKKKWVLTVLHPSITDCKKYSFEEQAKIFDCLPRDSENIIIYPNSDTGTDVLIKKIESLKGENIHRIESLDRKVYLSLFRNVNLLIGNSSSGIVESESFSTPVINLGDRQKGRSHSNRVFDIPYDIEIFKEKVIWVLENENKIRNKKMKRMYFKENVSQQIIDIIRKVDSNKLQFLKFK